MKGLTARLATLGVTVLALAIGPVAPVWAASAPSRTPITAQSWGRLTVQSLSPQVVDSSANTITVTATITNTSDRDINNVQAQLRIGGPLGTDNDIRAALAGTEPAGHGTPFERVTDQLRPGQSAPIALNVPVQGARQLDITQPGVYPVLVNVNGRPDQGSQARLAATSLLLPVVSASGRPATPTPPPDPAKLTVLWPLIDTQPRVVATSGSLTQPYVTLSDDSLATSLAPGGRLYGLVHSAAQAEASGKSVANALCFAIDPDLVRTVAAMTKGYTVRSGTGTVPGLGAADATEWLAAVRALVAGHCVLALPYADPDLMALTRAGETDLVKESLGDAADLPTLLGTDVRPLTGVVWPAADTIDQRTAADLTADGATTALLDPDTLQPTRSGGPVPLAGTSLRALPVDQLASSALGTGTTSRPTIPASGTTSANDQPAISTQNGLGTLVYQSMFAARPSPSMLITPPRRWSASAAALTAYLDTAQRAIDLHFAAPVGLPALATAAPAAAQASTLTYPPTASAAELPTSVTSDVTAQDAQQQDLQAAMRPDPANPVVQPRDLIRPLRLALLRATSTAWRDGRAAGAEGALSAATDQFQAITDLVTAQSPGGQVQSRFSNKSPLELSVHNGLPVDVKIKIKLSDEPGLTPGAIADPLLPADSSYTLDVPTTATRSGRFSVDASLTTPGGTPLGQTARLELVSNTYGTIVLVVTGIAFAALVLLSGRRIYRRVRAARAGAGAGTGGAQDSGQETDER